MKFTLSWLKEYLNTDANLETICTTLTMIGLEVEEVTNPSDTLGAFTVAHVVSAEQHPDADRLKVCMVDTGSEILQIVCGAHNARAGIKVCFAPVGTYIPGTDITLKKGVIRGQESNGMMCSGLELQISDDHDGILELPNTTQIGDRLIDVMDLNDPIIEIAITPNRGDCLGVYGIARDLAATGLGTLKNPKAPEIKGTFDSPITWQHTPNAVGTCPYVTGRTIRGVKNGPSPEWLQKRLRAIGLNPISALVDITNYVSYDRGRPSHVFDANTLSGNLVMDVAQQGESFVALDEKNYALHPGTTVIRDSKGVQSIGGVMGGLNTGCSDDTTDVFIEIALFDPIAVAQAGRAHGIESDARYRFERTVDSQSTGWGLDTVTQMILDLCGGEASYPIFSGDIPPNNRTASLRLNRLKTHIGIDIPKDEVVTILTRLGFAVTDNGDVLDVTIPSYRPDVTGEHCLIEEVVRIHGYDNLQAIPFNRDAVLPKAVITPAQRRVSFVRRALAYRGMNEALTWSFMARQNAELFSEAGTIDDSLVQQNPISVDLDTMRPSILPNLLMAGAGNMARGTPNIALFESGGVYHSIKPDGQKRCIAGIRTGFTHDRHWDSPPRKVDVFDAKGDVLAALEATGVNVAGLQVKTNAPKWYHPGRSGTLNMGKNCVAIFGEIHPKQAKAMGIKGTVVGFEIYPDMLPSPKNKGTNKPLLQISNLQPVHRDFAFVVSNDVTSAEIVRAVTVANRALIQSVTVFDVFPLENNEKSVAISVVLQPKTNTLTDDEIDAVSAKIVEVVAKNTNGQLRS